MDLKLTPRGQTKVHFPQSIHLSNAVAKSLYCPLRNMEWVLRILNGVKLPAEQVEVQAPQNTHRLNEGTSASIALISLSEIWSKLIVPVLEIWYPKFIIVLILF